MSECLITKLKSNVNNSSLARFGECVINFTNANTVKQEIIIIPHNTKGTTLTIEGNGAYLEALYLGTPNQTGTTFTFNTRNVFHVHSDGEYRLKFTNKYDIIEFIIIGNCNFDINVFKYMTKLTALNFAENYIVAGNFEKLDKLINLEMINYGDAQNIVCDVYKYLQALTDNGRTPGKELYIPYLNVYKNHTINGTVILKRLFKLNTFLTSDGKFYCIGKTEDSTDAPFSTVYCIGYTDEEIAAKWPDLVVVKCD